MLTIEIWGGVELDDVLQSNHVPYTRVISIRDRSLGHDNHTPLDELLTSHTKTECVIDRFVFNDIRGRKNTSPNAPDLDDVTRIVEIARLLRPSDHILVHCNKGVSRSTAVAAILLMANNDHLSEDSACREVRKSRPVSRPNQRLLWLYRRFKDESSPVLIV
jgi:protein tyrosine phosphatase